MSPPPLRSEPPVRPALATQVAAAGASRPRVLLALALLLLLIPGCRVISGTVSTVQALDDAGFSGSAIEPRSRDRIVVTVEKDAEDLTAAAEEAAGVVWRHLPLRIDRLEVTCGNGFGGRGTFAASRAELEQRFGSRDADLDRGLDEGFRNAGLILVGLFVVGLVVLGAIVTLILVLIRNAKKRNPPPGPPPPGGPGGWDPQGPPPGYGPPA